MGGRARSGGGGGGGGGGGSRCRATGSAARGSMEAGAPNLPPIRNRQIAGTRLFRLCVARSAPIRQRLCVFAPFL
ncbi:hypothetical protein R5R35_011820 [Gryllus longicercus]|uniref:Uncharacterized protein n=1 Tax=Gryllus longicercus TaxID=2509291 RepID=A0AAN9VZY2_9ORTH